MFAGRGLDEARLGEPDDAGAVRRSSVRGSGDERRQCGKADRGRAGCGERERIEILITSTESGDRLRQSTVASYVHDYLGLNRQCRVMEVKQACLCRNRGGAARRGVRGLRGVAGGEGADRRHRRVARRRAGWVHRARDGCGAAAVLSRAAASPRPRPRRVRQPQLRDARLRAARAHVRHRGRGRFLFAYLDCLEQRIPRVPGGVDGTDFATTFDFLAMHTPFAGIVTAGHRK